MQGVGFCALGRALVLCCVHFCWDSTIRRVLEFRFRGLGQPTASIPGPVFTRERAFSFLRLGFRCGLWSLPTVSFVVPFFWSYQFQIKLRILKGNPKKGTTMETIGRGQALLYGCLGLPGSGFSSGMLVRV